MAAAQSAATKPGGAADKQQALREAEPQVSDTAVSLDALLGDCQSQCASPELCAGEVPKASTYGAGEITTAAQGPLFGTGREATATTTKSTSPATTAAPPAASRPESLVPASSSPISDLDRSIALQRAELEAERERLLAKRVSLKARRSTAPASTISATLEQMQKADGERDGEPGACPRAQIPDHARRSTVASFLAGWNGNARSKGE